LPTLFQGEAYNGFASDVWSLGMTLYHCLFGRVAFKAENTVQLYVMIESQPVEFPEERMAAMHESLQNLLRR
jgi:serine/threonine protein kinase